MISKREMLLFSSAAATWTLAARAGLAQQATSGSAMSSDGAGEPLYFERYRPQYHYSPPLNFMNDPNGLVYFNGIYNLYYQYNPFGLVAGNQSWGHAISTDLVNWETQPIAIPETPAGYIFSGSAVVDANNTSGFFNGIPGGGIVAIYTLATYVNGQSVAQRQNIAYSLDGGMTYTNYSGNPVVDIGSSQFRDPQVAFHAETNQWVTAVAESDAWKVLFYASPDLKNWTQVGSFGPAGWLGGQYEVPNLLRVPIEGTGQTKWVLLVSINPGAPQGGSATQYFYGTFDGANFTPDDDGTRFMEFAKDAYAMEVYNNLPTSDAIAITWLSNWEYAQTVPTFPWRSQMSVPRVLTLKTTASDEGYVLAQNPIPAITSLRAQTLQNGSVTVSDGAPFSVSLTGSQSIEILVTMTSAAAAGMGMVSLTDGTESLTFAYDWGAQAVYIDRGGTQGFVNPYFTNSFSTNYAAANNTITLRALIDVSTLELFVDNGSRVASSLFFFKNPPNSLVFSAQGGTIQMNDLQVYTYRSIWRAMTQSAAQSSQPG